MLVLFHASLNCFILCLGFLKSSALGKSQGAFQICKMRTVFKLTEKFQLNIMENTFCVFVGRFVAHVVEIEKQRRKVDVSSHHSA